MLDRAGDADGDVEVGRHHLAGLADLVVVGHIAGIDRGAAGAQPGAELVGQGLEHLEVLAARQAAAAGDDDLGAGEFGTLALGEFGADIGREAAGPGAVDLLDRRGTAGDGRLEVGRADGDDLDLLGGLHGRHGVAGIDRTHEGVGRHDLDGLGDLGDVEQGGDARRDVLADRVGRHHDVAVVRRQLHDQRRDVLGQPVGVGRIVGFQHLGDALDGGSRLGGLAAAAAGDQHVDIGAHLKGRRHGVRDVAANGLAVMRGDNQNGHVRSLPLRCAACRPAPPRSSP